MTGNDMLSLLQRTNEMLKIVMEEEEGVAHEDIAELQADIEELLTEVLG